MFADAHSLMRVDPKKNVVSEEALPELEPANTDSAEDESEERDILGEMEIAARMMITGGEKRRRNVLPGLTAVLFVKLS